MTDENGGERSVPLHAPFFILHPSWELAGRTALVTGAAKRIGRAIALALAENGVHVVLHYRSSRIEVEATAAEVEKAGVRVWIESGDFASPGESGAFFDRVLATAGPMDILINSASAFSPGLLRNIAPEDILRAVETNALSPFVLARQFAQQGREGVVINLVDARMADYDRMHVGYSLSKQMLFSLTQMMALEFAPALRVNSVAPGLVLPPEGQDIEYLERLKSTNPLNRYGGVADIAMAVLFLVGNRFITGQVVFVDGGRHLRGSMYGC